MSEDSTNILSLYGLRDIKREREDQELFDSIVREQVENGEDEKIPSIPVESFRIMARNAVQDFFDHGTLTIGQRKLARPFIEDLATGLTAQISLKFLLGIKIDTENLMDIAMRGGA